MPGRARFRVNAFFQRNSLSAAFRLIPVEIPRLDDLGLPRVLHEFASKARGFVVITGPTGSGKSTTLAAMIDEINQTRSQHIITIEDPIEFLHQHKKCHVNQREVGSDTKGFDRALKSVLRQDPDVILVGEMRDPETMATALTAAETGHLVFATLHTQDAAQTIDRIIDVFPPHQQAQVRVQLSTTLMGVCTQQLLPTRDGRGRCVACEILVPTPAVRNLSARGRRIRSRDGHRDRRQVRDADDGRRAGRPGPRRQDHPGAGAQRAAPTRTRSCACWSRRGLARRCEMAIRGGYGVNRNGGGMSAYGRGDEGPPLGSGRRFDWEADAARRRAAGTDIRLGDRVSHPRHGVGVVRDHCGSEECRVSFRRVKSRGACGSPT